MAPTNIRTERARRISPPASRGEVSGIVIVVLLFDDIDDLNIGDGIIFQPG
jgi:hypothetical protein